MSKKATCNPSISTLSMYVVLTECGSHYWMNIICRGWIQQRELHETECIAMDYSSKAQEITGKNYLFIYYLS